MMRWVFAAWLLLGGVAMAQPVVVTPPGLSTAVPVPQLNGGTSFSPTQLPNWRACLAKMRQPTGAVVRCRAVFVGDSTIYGIGGTANSGNGTQPSITDFVSLYLNQAGIPTDANAVCGNGSTHGNQTRAGTGGTDQRFTGGAGSWATTLIASLGGGLINGSAASPTLVYTPITTYNSAAAALYPAMTPNAFNIIWYNALGTMTATATGGSAVTMTGTNGGTFQTTTATASGVSASNSVTFAATVVNGGPYLECIEPVNTNISSVDIFNTGIPAGTMLYDYPVGPGPAYNSTAAINYLAPALEVIMPGINDWDPLYNTPVATFIQDLTLFIQNAQANGSDVLLVIPNPTNYNFTQQAQYVASMVSLAQTYNIPVVNLNSILVSSTYMTTLGLSYGDGVHPNSPGYANMAREIANVMEAP